MLTCAYTHCVSKGSTLKALDRNFPLYPPQGERTELITMDTSKQQLFSVCGKGFIGTLVQDLNKYCVLISRCVFFPAALLFNICIQWYSKSEQTPFKNDIFVIRLKITV